MDNIYQEKYSEAITSIIDIEGVNITMQSIKSVKSNSSIHTTLHESNNNNVNRTKNNFRRKSIRRGSVYAKGLNTTDVNKLLEEIDNLYFKNKQLIVDKNELLLKIGELEKSKMNLIEQNNKLKDTISIKQLQINETQDENDTLKQEHIRSNIFTPELNEALLKVSEYELLLNQRIVEIENLQNDNFNETKGSSISLCY